MSKLLTTLAAGAATVLLAMPAPASAINASGPRGDGMKTSTSIEVSSAKRHRAHRHYRHYHRHYGWRGYYGRPYYGPRYYSGGPYYAASPYSYRPYYYRPGPRFYAGPFGFGFGVGW
ncbi:MAG TPA: hypothetical protein VNQ50_03510 [Xanthobacteraceae bacterium]|nr:hypothetical protein [Xanthobacteraceae bacterium]